MEFKITPHANMAGKDVDLLTVTMSRWTVENHQFTAKERLGISKAALLTRIAIQYKVSPLTDALSAAEQKKLASTAAKGKAKTKAKRTAK